MAEVNTCRHAEEFSDRKDIAVEQWHSIVVCGMPSKYAKTRIKTSHKRRLRSKVYVTYVACQGISTNPKSIRDRRIYVIN